MTSSSLSENFSTTSLIFYNLVTGLLPKKVNLPSDLFSSGLGSKTGKICVKKEQYTCLSRHTLNQNKEELEDELEKVEAAIAKMVGKENHDKIYDTFKVLDQNEGDNFAYEIWKSDFCYNLCLTKIQDVLN